MRLTRRQLLGSAAAGAVLGPGLVAASAASGAPEYLVVVIAEGGWDVTFVFDDKLASNTIQGPEMDEDPNDPEDREESVTYGGLHLVGNPTKRPVTDAFFSTWHSRCCVMNGLWMGSIAHDPCRFRILTGTQDGRRPDLATMVGYRRGGTLPLGTVDLSGWSLHGSLAASAGRVGAKSQILPLVDPMVRFDAAPEIGGAYPLYAPDLTGRAAIDAFLAQRAAAQRDRFGGGAVNDRRLDDLAISVERSARFRSEGRDILSALTLGTQAGMITQAEIAASLLKNGLCRTVTLDSRRDWDTHDANVAQHENFEALFYGLDVLLSSLEANGILDRTTVAVVSEMTRTPALNADAGKDHWGHTSALLIGAGVRGDTMMGGTDDSLESMPVDYATGEVDPSGRPAKYENLTAGLLELFDVDPEEWLPGVEPFRGMRA